MPTSHRPINKRKTSHGISSKPAQTSSQESSITKPSLPLSTRMLADSLSTAQITRILSEVLDSGELCLMNTRSSRVIFLPKSYDQLSQTILDTLYGLEHQKARTSSTGSTKRARKTKNG